MSERNVTEMLRLLSGYWFSQTLHVVAVLGIADRLLGGPKTADALAAETHVDSDGLFRVLRGLSSANIFAEVAPRTFALTPLSETLVDTREGSLRPLAILGGHPMHWQAWGQLLHTVITGQPAFEAAHGRGFFEALGDDSALAATFQRILGNYNLVDRTVADALVITPGQRVVDLGGGSGGLARQIVRACPQASVVLFDRPEVIRAHSQPPGVECVAGDFFESIPAGADTYVLKFVLHDWNDSAAAQILTKCRDALRPSARLYIIEVILPNDSTPSIAKTHDVDMLVLTGGRERTLAEYTALLHRAGLTLARTLPTSAGVSVMNATRADE